MSADDHLQSADDLAVLRAGERPGTMDQAAFDQVVASWGIDHEITEMLRRLGLEPSAQ